MAQERWQVFFGPENKRTRSTTWDGDYSTEELQQIRRAIRERCLGDSYEFRAASAPPETRVYTLPLDDQARKDTPLVAGCFRYFPAALAEVARHSKASNDKHNPGQPMHWSRGKSSDEDEAEARHMFDAAEAPTAEDVTYHLRAKAWRALAELQKHLEKLGAPLAPAARGAS